MHKNQQQATGTALALSAGILDQKEAKTTHGLLRGSERFELLGLIDHKFAGQDAGSVLDGQPRQIPIFAQLTEAINAVGKPDYLIIGIATVGGVLPDHLMAIIRAGLKAGISIVNGLHDYLQDHEDLRQLAEANNAQLIDIRKPKKIADLHFWTEEIFQVDCPIVAVLGMDCAVGKRTTAKIIHDAVCNQGEKAEMIFTGQTGWMQGAQYGFIFDSTLNDFVSGELARAVLDAFQKEQPALILLEGQSSLRNPSGPCGPEYLISANAKKVVLVHEIKKEYFDDLPAWGPLPSLQSEIDLIRAYGSEVIALSLNTRGCTLEEAKAAQANYQSELGIPVVLPLEEGVEEIIPLCLQK
ncbi:MAG TPA: DUF1611 domain-containing protein [Saprospiraceae bacterium]|nr:DUF1611 domain-containing protein [Saprospiraceae bacterium]